MSMFRKFFVLSCFGSSILGMPANSVADILLGALLPLSGAQASIGKSQEIGIRLALDEINSTPLAVGKLSIKLADDQGNPAVAVAKTLELIQVDRIRYILGAPLPNSAMAILPKTVESKILFVTTGSIASTRDMKVGTAPLWFHVGTHLDRLDEARSRVEKNTNLTPASRACTFGEATNLNGLDFSICGWGFGERKAWETFRAAVQSKGGDQSLANLSAVLAYTATKILYEAISLSASNPEETAVVLRERKFASLLGTRSFGKEQ